jgi:hypothetical protein
LCIDFVYDWVVDAHQGVVIPREALRTHPFSVQTWDAQSSGTVIKPIAEGALEKRWAELTGKRKPPKLDAPGGLIRSSKVTAHKAAAEKTAAAGHAKTKPEPPTKKPAAKRTSKTKAPPKVEELRFGVRSAAGGMTALSLRPNVRGHRFQMHHYRRCARDPLMSWRGEPLSLLIFLCGGKESKCRPAQGQTLIDQ